ncbi:hypothetical protein E2C01_098141 [Portunus trituberculatus]|uniref:Uncharacterized protein n=1 Tax=Portunus trituberculatus TaxID=210409 RepID=A0A5B7JX11_PORTR|nr:hypothetical protein [Portunus trituberculatus]
MGVCGVEGGHYNGQGAVLGQGGTVAGRRELYGQGLVGKEARGCGKQNNTW